MGSDDFTRTGPNATPIERVTAERNMLRAQLTAATERAEKAEAERDELEADRERAWGDTWPSALERRANDAEAALTARDETIRKLRESYRAFVIGTEAECREMVSEALDAHGSHANQLDRSATILLDFCRAAQAVLEQTK